MATSLSTAERTARVLRIIARALSVLIVAFTVVMFIADTRAGEGPFNSSGPRQNVAEPWEVVLSLVALAGVIIAWRWELLGGAVAVGSMVLFEGIALFAGSVTQPIILFGPAGACFLLAALLTRYAHRSRGPSPSAGAGVPAPPPRPIGP